MPVHDLECPNCGATVKFGNSLHATCAYCQSALMLTGGRVQPEPGAVHRPDAALPSSIPPASTRPLVKTWRPVKMSRLLSAGCLLAIVGQLLFVCVCGGFMALASNVLLRIWGPLDEVTTLVNEQPEITRALGKPIRLGAATESSLGSSTVEFSAPLLGKTANGKAQVIGRWTEAGWDLEVWVTYRKAGEEQQVFVQRRRPR